jgi:hypothetical protein
MLPPGQLADIIDVPWTPRYLDKDFLQQKYEVERLSAEELAALVPCAVSTVIKYLRVHGIAVRDSGDNIRRQRGVGYGRRIAGREQVEHKAELATIAKMADLRRQGFSYWKIADILNSMKIPTKTRRGKWHARSVQQILDRHKASESVSTVT